MEKLVRPQRGARFIGISNFSPRQLEDVLRVAMIKPKVHQVEIHPYLPQEDFVALNVKYNISMTGYAPLGNTNPVYGELGARQPPLLSNTIVNEIAKARGCTPAQVILAWNMKRGVGVIPKAAKVEHQKENIATLEKCKLESADMEKMKGVNVSLRVNQKACQPLEYKCFEGLAGF
jgi:alcohol dehydrogenase (NADP+)